MNLLNLFKFCFIFHLLYIDYIYCFVFYNFLNPELNKLNHTQFHLSASRNPKSSKYFKGEKERSEEDFHRILETAKSLNLTEKDLNEYALKHLPNESLRKRFLYLINPKKVENLLPKRLRKHLAILPQKNLEYSIDEAISRIKIISGTKFVEGIDVAIRIPVTTKKAKSTAGQYSKLITIPYKSLKSKRTKVGIFGIKDTVEEIKSKGLENLVFIGGEDLIKEFKEKQEVPEVNLVLSDVETYPKLSLLGKLLSKKGLMPNLAVGTVIESKTEFLEIVDDLIHRNVLVIKSDKAGDIKCNFADVSMPLDEIRTNLLEIFRYLKKNKPPYSTQKFVDKIFISSSMGPSFRLNVRQLRSNSK
ncbi:Ribosomal protein L1p/L10e family protein [Theileria parva strain Muguga]|uniref:Ribosomal protein L1p/L10e family protein n=1 Tax=Theileria parva strain Muguga TaxID=333668 RepID=UPI001C618B55|nr:Ribosomal protein L1p/L10e family protein [Theileria parva strain Muguga]KAF5153503.1 Ribosomal protein L1p/L10e family protein [Theileria parva strain Muguga]